MNSQNCMARYEITVEEICEIRHAMANAKGALIAISNFEQLDHVKDLIQSHIEKLESALQTSNKCLDRRFEN